MTTRHQTLIAAALVVLAAACSETTAPIEARAIVTVPDTLVTRPMSSSNAQWMQLTIPVSIRNTASVPLTFSYCASSIEAQNGGSWTNVWSPICALSSEASLPILPGETRVVSMPLAAVIAGNGGPVWGTSTVEGTYRVLAALVPEGFSGIIPTVSSNAFVLRQGN